MKKKSNYTSKVDSLVIELRKVKEDIAKGKYHIQTIEEHIRDLTKT